MGCNIKRHRIEQIVLIGAGGQGKETAEILEQHKNCGKAFKVLGFIDEDSGLQGSTVSGLRVLGDFAWLERQNPQNLALICCVGNPRATFDLVKRAMRLGFHFINAISPYSNISPQATLGIGVTVYANVVVNTGVKIGDHCILNVGTSVSHDAEVGSYCNLNPGTRLAGNVRLGDGCYLGMGCTVIQGRSIGAWTTIGAGAAVVRDLPDQVTAVGVPACIIRRGRYERMHKPPNSSVPAAQISET